MAFFLEDSDLSSILDSDDLFDITVGILSLKHDNKFVAKVSAMGIFHRQGGSHRRSTIYNDWLDDSNAQNSAATLVSEGIIEKVSEYINTSKINRAKAVIIFLMQNGELYTHLDKMNITNSELLAVVEKYYKDSKIAEDIHFDNFYSINPKAAQLTYDRHYFLYGELSNLKEAFKLLPDVTKEEEFRFVDTIPELRKEVNALIYPNLQLLYQLFDISRGTYEKNKIAARNELSQIL
jgi:hypothetical protein